MVGETSVGFVKAGRDNKMSNCNRCRECSEIEDGKQCTAFHHPLLHQSKKATIGIALTNENLEAVLPIISANICGPNRMFKRGNVLFHSSVQVSLVK